MDCKQGNHMARDFDNLYHFFTIEKDVNTAAAVVASTECICRYIALLEVAANQKSIIGQNLLYIRSKYV